MEVLVIDGKGHKDDPEQSITSTRVKTQIEAAIFTVAQNKRVIKDKREELF
jgi:stress response protein SCP2